MFMFIKMDVLLRLKDLLDLGRINGKGDDQTMPCGSDPVQFSDCLH
jgi:hypothetical protein